MQLIKMDEMLTGDVALLGRWEINVLDGSLGSSQQARSTHHKSCRIKEA